MGAGVQLDGESDSCGDEDKGEAVDHDQGEV